MDQSRHLVFTKFSKNKSKEESDRQSSNYAKEITDRSVNKLTERVRKERISKTIEEFEENNLHKFENSLGDNKSGIYRWVDKYYRQKVITYGKRLFYEFFIPEPAAFYIFAKNVDRQKNELPEEPLPFENEEGVPIGPDIIERDNYLDLAAKFDAEGITAPPPEEVIISKVIAREFSDATAESLFAITDSELNIPDGYTSAGHNGLWFVARAVSGDDFDFSFALSASTFMVSNDTELRSNGINLSGISGNFPIAAVGRGAATLLITIKLVCTLLDEELEKWKIHTFNALFNAHNKKVLDYQENLLLRKSRQVLK